jgi:hypothetical protein
MIARLAACSLALLLAIPWPAAAAQSPVTQNACPDPPRATTFATIPGSGIENLAFDRGGGLLATAFHAGHVLRFTPDGKSSLLLDTHEGFGGVAGVTIGPDGDARIGVENGSVGEIWRFSIDDPSSHTAIPTPENETNGMAFDEQGNLYSTDFASSPYLVRYADREPTTWRPWSTTYGYNGLWFDEQNRSLLGSVTLDGNSRIMRISIDRPDDAATVAQLSSGATSWPPAVDPHPDLSKPAAPKWLDDLTLGPDGLIYVAAHVTGEVLRVDPRDGASCVLLSGLHEPTSVRFARQFGTHDGNAFVGELGGEGLTAIETSATGRILELNLGFDHAGSPQQAPPAAREKREPGRNVAFPAAMESVVAAVIAVVGSRRSGRDARSSLQAKPG